MRTRIIYLPICLAVFAFFRVQVLIAELEKFDADEYVQKVAEINTQLALADSTWHDWCPISRLVLTCGDNKCDPSLENADNCPADCLETSLKSYNDQISCPGIEPLHRPKGQEEVQSLIKRAREQGRHARVVGSRHSVNEQYCTDGIALTMEAFNQVIGIHKEEDGSETVEVEAGATMGDLADWLHERGKTLGYVQLGFRLATVGGAIATGAHGSSAKHTAVVASLVQAVTLINSAGEVLEITKKDGDLLRSLRAHLGMFGVVIKVKLKIISQFRLHVSVTKHKGHELLEENGLSEAIKDCDYALINWFPKTNRYIKTCGIETEERADLGAENTLLNPKILPGLELPFNLALHYGMCSSQLNAGLEYLRYLFLKWRPPFQKIGPSGDLISTGDVVGYSHRMMSSKFIESKNDFFQNDWELAIPFSKAFAALKVVYEHTKQNDMHLPLVGFLLRFAPSEDATLMAHTTSVGAFNKNEPVLLIEFPTPTPIGFPADMRASINYPYEQLARILITEFGARPHWGKNEAWTFKLQNELGSYGKNLDVFKTLVQKIDPVGMFATNFARQIGLTGDR